jgi:hypothetical protein
MKDIMQKLAELEATAPKVTKKKMLNEDSTTPPMNVSNKPASLKDLFHALSESIPSGQKPLPVLDPQNKQAGMGFVTSNNPAVQNMLKALDPKDVQIVQAPGQPGQPQVGQQQQQQQTGQQQQQTGQPAPAGATGQPQQGQMQMKEKKLDELSPETLKSYKQASQKRDSDLRSAKFNMDLGGPNPLLTGRQGDAKPSQTAQRLATKYVARDEKNRADQAAAGKSPLGSDPALSPKWAPQLPHGIEQSKRNFGANLAQKKIDRKAAQQANWERQASSKWDDPVVEGAKVDRMVKHIEKSEKKSGKSKDEASDIAWATANKRGMLDNKNKKKVKEGDIPSSRGVDTIGAGLGAGRSKTTLEGKKPDFLDLDKDGNKKEPMKKAVADKNKKKVKESMNHRISAARLEGKSHGLRGHAHSGKRYEDLDEVRAYHEGYKEGLDECYGQGVYETAPAMPAATVPGMADQEMEEGKLGKALTGAAMAATLAGGGMMAKGAYDYHKKDPISHMSQADMDDMSYRITKEDDMEEGNAFTAALAKTPKGGKFAVGGKTFTDRTGYDAKVNEYAFESLDQQLNALLNESEEVSEGLSVSISKGQQNSPDSVTITAQDQEAEHLLAFVKNAGLGLFGDDNADTHSSAMSVQPSHGAPDEVGAGGIDIGVVDGHDGMMGLMQKLSGIQAGGAEDYADEEGDEEQLYGNHQTADKKDCGCDGDCECSDYDQPSNEETCNECGGMMEAGHSCGSKEVVDEVESEDQMEFEVAEDNAPDSGEAESTADEDAEAKEDAALAGADSGDEEEMNEGSGDEPKHRNSDDKDDKDFDDEEKVSESSAFASLFKKLSMISEEATDKEDEKAEKAGKKVTKDIEYDDKKDKKGMSDKQAKFFGKKADKEKVDEWANNAGPGKTVSDTTFEQDIDFMTKVISGGLNKQKSTGQTTIPVIAGQEDRIHDESTNTPANFAKLAGIK